jgi:putative RecB family exonuclease
MRDYEWQMSVYAHLYRVKSGAFPTHAVLYFLNELKTPAGTPKPTSRPLRAVHTVDFMRDGMQPDGTPTLVHQGLQAFGQTAQDIIVCKAARHWPHPTGAETPDEKSCNICDIRWNCPSRQGQYPDRYPL